MTSFIFIFALAPHFRNSVLSEEAYIDIYDNLLNNRKYHQEIEKFLETLNNANVFEAYPVTSYLRSDSRGVYFDVSSNGKDLVAKIFIEKDNEFALCKKNQILKKLEDKNVSFVNRLIISETFTGSVVY